MGVLQKNQFRFWLLFAGTALFLAPVSNSLAQGAYEFGQRFSALGFGEIDYRESDGPGFDGFIIGQFVGQLSARIDDRMSVFTEITATARQGEDFEFEVERLVFRYDFSDQYKLSVGRYHTPLGYWNAAFHHGSWLQTTVLRPNAVKFGSFFVPVHFVGGLLEGNFGQSDFFYRVGLGNGRSDEINDPGDFGDVNSKRAWLFSGHYRPVTRNLLRAGLSVYFDRATPAVGPEVDEVLYSGYVAIEGERPEIIVEYHYGDHERTNTPGPNGSTQGGYGQFAYRLTGSASAFKPYVRIEYVDADNDDPLLGTLGLDHEGILAGVRWDFGSSAALKAEIRNEEFNNMGTDKSIWLQLAFVLDNSQSSSYSRPHVTPSNYGGMPESRSDEATTR